ncbi:MAG: hypothetical protein LBB28_01075 [Synergistaceae bacterium]|nr:hypothetical protein [Synergistaceae bacterium]
MARHVKMLYTSCAGFILGFYLSYQGGISENDALIMASFAVLGLSCALALIAKK